MKRLAKLSKRSNQQLANNDRPGRKPRPIVLYAVCLCRLGRFDRELEAFTVQFGPPSHLPYTGNRPERAIGVEPDAACLLTWDGIRGRSPLLAGKEGNGRGERIRTSGLLVPNQALYQAEPRPEPFYSSGCVGQVATCPNDLPCEFAGSWTFPIFESLRPLNTTML